MAVATGEAAMQEGFNQVADCMSHFTLEFFKPQISLSIQNQVNTKFCESNLMSLVRKIYALDSISKSQSLRGKIDRIVAEIINPEHKFWLDSGILLVFHYVKQLGSQFSMVIRILGTLNGIHQIVFIIDNVDDQLVKKLSQIDKEQLQIAQLLHKYCQIEQKDTREIVEILKNEGIILIQERYNTTFLDQVWNHVSNATLKELNPLTFYLEYINPLAFETNINEHKSYKMPKTSFDKDDFGKHNQHKSKIFNFCQQLHKGTLSLQIKDSYGMGALTATISNSIQDKLIRNCELVLEGQQTYAGLINQEAKKYTITYNQCEIIHYSQQKDKNNTNNKAVSSKERQTSNLADMFSMATENGIDLKIVDDQNYQLSEKDIAKGTKVVVFTKRSKDIEGKDDIGHYQLLGEDGKLVDIESNGNNCGYAVFAQLTGKSIGQLRIETSKGIEANSQNFFKAIEAQTWIKNRFPQEVNSLLFRGGCAKCYGIKVNEKEYILAQADSKQIIVKKTWYRLIKDSTGLIKTITKLLTDSGELAILVSGGILAPMLVPVISFAQNLNLAAMVIDMGNELYKTGSDHGFLSNQFCKQIQIQLEKNSEDLVLLCTKLGVLKEPEIQKNHQIKSKKFFRKKDVKQFLTHIDISEQNMKQITSELAILENLNQIQKEREKISNYLYDITKGIKKVQNMINPSQLNLIKSTAQSSGEFTIEYNVSIQALTLQKEERAKEYYGSQWDKLNNNSKSSLLTYFIKNEAFFNRDKLQLLHGKDINYAIYKEVLNFNPDQLKKNRKLTQTVEFLRLRNQIKTVLDNPNKQHTFCQNEKDMLNKSKQ